jgi:hypothetical protein
MTCTIFSCVARIVSKKDFAIELMCVLGPKCSCVIHTEQVYIHSQLNRKEKMHRGVHHIQFIEHY